MARRLELRNRLRAGGYLYTGRHVHPTVQRRAHGQLLLRGDGNEPGQQPLHGTASTQRCLPSRRCTLFAIRQFLAAVQRWGRGDVQLLLRIGQPGRCWNRCN